MPSVGQNEINGLSIDNQAVKDLKELIHLSQFEYGSITETLTVVTGAKNGKKVGFVGQMEPVGRRSNGCEPQWRASKIAASEKVMELEEYEVAEKACYTDIKDTMARYALKSKTDIADLTGTDYMDVYAEPAMQEALKKMLWRLFWFGNKDAKNFSTGGSITNTVDVELFKVCDGLFKRIFDITAGALNKQRIVISANTSATYEDQIAGFNALGVATKITTDLIQKAPAKLRLQSNAVILCTQSYADALANDVKASNKGSELHWESLFEGLMYATKWNTKTLIALPLWDEMIQAFEDTGTMWNKPHRAVFTPISNLWGLVDSESEVADLQIFFDKPTQMNHMLAKDELGTLIPEDDMLITAY